MRLNDPLPTSIFFEGKQYPLNLAFNNVLDVLEILNNNKIMVHLKLPAIIEFLIGENDLNMHRKAELWKIIRTDYIENNEKKPVKEDILGNIIPVPEDEDDDVKTIDLERDAKYIYASFRQIGINLFSEQNKMQWCEFQALIQALPDDTILQRIIQIRLWKPSKGESGEYKAQMRKLQEKYRLDGGDDDE